jgi:diaminohydroxyphosphoribosylaminopyrimidine deaminase/5-amino-6-(5-phosphoribosylamino)uracil reductase
MFMAAALDEARKGIGQSSPNPAVGAVIVSKGKIIAAGFHRAAGQPHAEIEALRALPQSADAAGSSIYITMEPCSTTGRTPPCTSAIIEHRFARVIYGATDPNPAHAGRAQSILTVAGIAVTSGVLASECSAINEAWNHWICTRLPFVIAKCGMSLDGRISSHPSGRWITSIAARRDTMARRATVDAVLVGGQTARDDNPRLTVRGIRVARQPWRVVWSPSGDLPPTLHLFTDRHRDKTLVCRHPRLRDVLEELGRRDITSVLIEGGGRTLGEAFDSGLVQRVEFYVAPVLIGGPVPAVGGVGVAANDEAIALKEVRYETVGTDLKISALVG